jgi:2-oxoglutarate dehydrogenase E1 component
LKAAEQGVETVCDGNGTPWSFECIGKYFLSTQDIFGEFDGKDYDKEYFDGDVKYHLGLADKITVQVKNKHQFST